MGWHRGWDVSQQPLNRGLSLAEVAVGYRSRLRLEMRYLSQMLAGVYNKVRASWR